MKKWIIALILIMVISVGMYKMEEGKNKIIILKTNMGTVKIELASDMPITTGNFINLVEAGTYDGVIFHRSSLC